MFRDAVLVAGKDLRIERRTKVAIGQIAPFALTILMIFGFALDPDTGILVRAAAGLFWVAVLLSSVLAVQRSFAIESRDGMRLSGLDPSAIFLGKATAVAAQLIVLQAMLIAGVVFIYSVSISDVLVLVATCALSTVGLAAAGTIYGVLAMGVKARETLLPLLFLPALAPVLLASARATEAAFGGYGTEATPWLKILIAFAVVYVAAGTVAFGPLLEDS